MQHTTRRIAQLRALRDRLNLLGDHFYASTSTPLFICVRPHQFSDQWNRRRIAVRNRINARLRAA